MTTQATDIRALIEQTLEEHRQVLEGTLRNLVPDVQRAADLLVSAYQGGGKAILFGNGGSMTDALHIEGELVNRFAMDRPGLPAVALAGPASLSSTANDYTYGEVFARMLVAHASPGDVALGLSTSGNSENVVRALMAARKHHLPTIALTGHAGGECGRVADVCIAVPSASTPRIQEMHITIGHMLCAIVERTLFDAP